MAVKLFVDSDILLDIFLARPTHVDYAQALLNLHNNPQIQLSTSVIIVNNAYYFIQKDSGSPTAKQAIRLLSGILNILSVDEAALQFALDSDFKDFEDALQYHTAVKHGCQYIITRNIKDYKHSAIPVHTAEQFLKTL